MTYDWHRTLVVLVSLFSFFITILIIWLIFVSFHKQEKKTKLNKFLILFLNKLSWNRFIRLSDIQFHFCQRCHIVLFAISLKDYMVQHISNMDHNPNRSCTEHIHNSVNTFWLCSTIRHHQVGHRTKPNNSPGDIQLKIPPRTTRFVLLCAICTESSIEFGSNRAASNAMQCIAKKPKSTNTIFIINLLILLFWFQFECQETHTAHHRPRKYLLPKILQTTAVTSWMNSWCSSICIIYSPRCLLSRNNGNQFEIKYFCNPAKSRWDNWKHHFY